MAGWCRAVGWNWMNSTSATGTPARRAMARPSPVDWSGLVVTENSWPAPPVARRVSVARDLDQAAVRSQGRDAPAPPVGDDQVEREPAFRDARPRSGARPSTRARSISSAGGRPAGVDHPGHRVASLAGQLQPAPVVGVEHRAQGDQLVDPTRALVDEDPDGVGIAQPGPGRQRVGQVEVGRVLVLRQHRGHAALGPPGGRVRQLPLRQHPDAQSSRRGARRPPAPRPTVRRRRCRR